MFAFNSSGYTQKADLLFGQHRFDLAAVELRKAAMENADDWYAHSLLALCLVELRDMEEAYKEARHGLSIAPEASYAHYALAFVFARDRKFRQSEKAVLKALHLDPYNADYFSLLASVRLVQDNLKGALEAAETGLSIQPGHPSCTDHRTQVLLNMGRTTEAVQAARWTLEQKPDDPKNHASLGWSLLDAHDYPAAEAHFRESLRLDPTQAGARRGLLTALKTRRPVYRLVHRYSSWSNRIGSRGRSVFNACFFVALIGLVMALFSWPHFPRLGYVGIGLVLLAWVGFFTADAAENVLLFFEPSGRHLLTRDQVIRSASFLTMLAVIGLATAGWLIRKHIGWFYVSTGGVWTVSLTRNVLVAKSRGDRFASGLFLLAIIVGTVFAVASCGL